MRKNLSSILLGLVFLIGLSVLLYPTVSDYWNSRTQSKAIVDYKSILANYKPEDYTQMFTQADNYNDRLKSLEFPLKDYEQIDDYNDILNVGGNGIIGYINIEKIGVQLPIYHGTSSQVLNVAVGHLEGSSLPVGGEGTHAVLSAHRGLPSAKLFTDLDKLEEGDTFVINVLDRILTYEVNQIHIVEPHEVSDLQIQDGKDYCTLLTCTPYGINSHRLLVRGERIENAKQTRQIVVKSEARKVDAMLVAPLVAVPILLVLLIYLLVKTRKRKD